MNSAAFFKETPPVGISSICGSGAFSDFRNVAPPTALAGKIFTSTAASASSDDVARTTGMMPMARICSTTDTGSPTFHHLLDFGERGHARVARRRHRQCAVRGAALDGPPRTAVHEKAVDQPRGER